MGGMEAAGSIDMGDMLDVAGAVAVGVAAGWLQPAATTRSAPRTLAKRRRLIT